MTEAQHWGVVNSVRLQSGLQGAYVPKFDLILLDEGLTVMQRRCVLAHEISHAKHRDSLIFQ